MIFRTVTGEMNQLFAGRSGPGLPVSVRDELVWPWDPCFYRKVLRCAHTGSPRSHSGSRRLSAGAQRRTHSKRTALPSRTVGNQETMTELHQKILFERRKRYQTLFTMNKANRKGQNKPQVTSEEKDKWQMCHRAGCVSLN